MMYDEVTASSLQKINIDGNIILKADNEGGVRRGREAIAQTFRDNLERLDPWPFTHNHVIDFEGPDQARGFAYAEFRLGSEKMHVKHVGVTKTCMYGSAVDANSSRARSRPLLSTTERARPLAEESEAPHDLSSRRLPSTRRVGAACSFTSWG